MLAIFQIVRDTAVKQDPSNEIATAIKLFRIDKLSFSEDGLVLFISTELHAILVWSQFVRLFLLGALFAFAREMKIARSK